MATRTADSSGPRLVAYGITSLGLVLAMVLALSSVVPAHQAAGLRMAGAVAWVTQLATFWLVARAGTADFLVAWLSGMVLRLAAVGLAVAWVVTGHDAGARGLLLGLVGLLFLLSLLEAKFLQTLEHAT